MKQSTNRSKTRLYLILALAGLVTLLLWPSLVAAMPLTARHHLERAWTLAADMDRYNYQSTVLQTSHPTLTLGNVGRTARTEQIVIDGRLDRPAQLMTMNLAAPNQPPLEVRLEEGQAYGRMNGVEDGMEDWVEIEAGADLFAPGGDPLGFLNVVENVTQLGQATGQAAAETEYFPPELLPAEMAASISRYQFDISGLKYAQQMRAGLEEAMRQRGELPGGMTLQTPQKYVDMTGHGEIWVGEDGLPLRQIVRLTFPSEPGADNWIEAEITTTFTGWQAPGLKYALLKAIPRVVEDPALLTSDPLGLVPQLGSPLVHLRPDDLKVFGFLLGLGLLLIALAMLTFIHRRSPKVYGAFAVSMIIMMVGTPLLQGQQVQAASTRLRDRQARFDEQRAAHPSPADAPAETPASTFNPHINPLADNPAEHEPLTIDNSQFAAIPNSSNSPAVIPQRQTTCVITATSDCDGDGLTDNVEIYELGTRIDKIDTDDDGISDGTEVAPFSVDGQNWYLDPRNADSNGDGLDDGAECLGRTDVITTTLLTPLLDACDDADADGVPNVHDFDDDGDGVPDNIDLAHLNVQTVTNQIFNLEISGAAADTNLFVDFQIRPTDERHLWRTNNVLNWPAGDTSGQIRRVTTDTLATDGDMQLIPMLEIVIPYSSDNPSGSLPISSSQTITQTTPITTWLDTAITDPYKISIVTTENGDRVVYLPLTLTTDPNGGSPVAWQARMPYRLASGVSSWGAAHQVKLTWIVSAQNDRCEANCDDPANWQSSTQILQTYYDDFIVTGMKVQEYHGAEAMMVAQSINTGPYEPELWHLADTLQDAYFSAQTVGNQRFTLGNIPTTYTNWGLSSGSLLFNHITGLIDDVALLKAVSDDAVPAFLRTRVYPGGPADGTVANVMLLSEDTHRLRTMGDSEIIDNGDELPVIVEQFAFANNTFSVDMASAPLETSGTMRLQPYKYAAGLGWDTVAINLFMADLETDLEGIFTTSVMADLLSGDTVTDPDRARAGAVLLAMNYYLGLFLPTALPLVIEGELIGGDPLDNSQHQRPTQPAAAIVQRLATQLKSYFGLLSLNQLDIPTVESDKSAGAAASWAALADSQGAILEGFGDVLQGNTTSSAALALLEISGYGDTVDTANLLDLGVYAIMDYVLRDYLAGEVIPFLIDQPPSPDDDERCGIVICGTGVAVYATKRLSTLFSYNKKIVKTVGQLNNDFTRDHKALKVAKSYLGGPNDNIVKNRIRAIEQRISKTRALYHATITSKVKFWALSGVITQGVISGVTITIALAAGQVQADSPAFSRLVAEQISALLVETFQAILYLVALTTATFALSIFLAVVAIIDVAIAAICEAQFPILADADGDGLRSQALGGVDPDDSTPDSDSDGLNDFFELNTMGFDPAQADSDCDGLSDYYELFYRTDPTKADSDGDGLRDGEEMLHPNRLNPYENSLLSNANAPGCANSAASYTGGWPIVYDYDAGGNPLATWVSADPLKVDSDDDTLTDIQERIYAYNPNVASTLNVLRLDSQIATDSGVMPFVSPTGSISYTAVVTNELALPYARGLLEAELPLDNVLRTQSLGIVAPKSAVTTNGNIDVAEAGLTTSGPVDMGLRAGAILDDPTGRVLWLHLNEPAGSTIFADDSFLQNDGACSGGNCPTAGGQALTFDGDDAIIVPDSDSLDVSEYTIAMAVRPTTSGSARTLLRKGETTGPAPYDLALLLELSSNNEVDFVTFYDDCTSQTGNRLTSPALPLNQWSHITASYDGSTKKLYLNGELVASTAYNQTPCVNNDPLSIGAMFHGGNLFSGFTGQIDEVEIFPTVLDEQTILANYATPFLQLDLRDSATWGNSGLSCNDAHCPATSGNGVAFDQTKYLNVTAPDLSADAFSFATWIKPKSRTAPMNSEAATAHGKETDRDWQGVFGNMVYDNSQSSWPYATTIYPSLFVSSDGALRMTMANNSPACQLTTNATGLVQNDVWQHVAVSYDGSNFTFYVNGEPVTGGLTGASCAGITPPIVSTMYLGRPNDYGYAWIDRLNITDVEDEFAKDAPMDARLNVNDDGADGNIWESGRIDSTGVRAINKSFFVLDSSQWLRLWEYDREDSKAYQPNSTFWNNATDDNWLHFTNIKNTTYLGLNGYDFEGPNQESSGVARTANGTLYFGVFNDYFQGELDDFRVYNYALNDRVVADMYNASAVALDLPFDEAPGANLFADESGNYVTVSCSGDTCPTSGVPGRFNQALEFDGVDDYLTIGTASSELGTSEGSFSAMMWIKPDTFQGTNDRGQVPLIDVDDDHRLGLIGFGRPGAWAGDIASVDSANSLYNATGRWYHLAYVFENGKYTFYVNGQEKGSDLLAKPGAANTLRIGRETQTVQGNTFDFYFDGLLDDLTIVKRALSQAEVQTYLNRAPAINLHLDEDLSLTSFADDSENRYTATCASGACPDGGDKGQIREAVTFGGSDNLTLANTADLDLTDFSVGLWVKPTKTVNTAQRLMTKSDTSFFNANFRLWLLAGSMTVRFDRQHTCQGSEGNWHTLDAGTPLLENQWNHVLATHDSTNGVMKIYINGALAGTNAAVGNTVCTANSTPIRLGQNFNGGLDEVIVTPAILSDEQVAAIYNYQAAWFDVINQHSIFVDADSPSVDLTLTPAHFSTARTPFYIGAEDASSPLAGVEYRLDGGAWQAAQPNGGDASSAAWLFYFEEAAGTHTIEARATDSVGNMSAIASATVNVDDQAPTLTLNTAGGVVKVVEDYTFGGTVSDADSGVTRNGVTVSTVDHTGNPVSGNQSASLQSNNWQAHQSFPEMPYGVYTATVNDLDEAGNIATASGLFELDGLPPYADVTDNENYLNSTAAKTITGIASDVPYPTGGRTLHLHFEPVDGLWVDGADTGFRVVCNAGECPIAGVTGQRGAAISFDGLDDALAFTKDEVMTTTTTVQQLGLTDGSFTVMSWVNAPTWGGDQAILGSSPNTASDGFYLGLQNGRPILGYEGDDTAMPNPIPTSEWVHLAWRFDTNSGERAFFVNGTLSFTSTGHSAYSLVDEPIALGSARDGSAFGGSLDELVIYAQPLADETIYDIANPLDVGISDLALRIRSYDERDIGQFEGTWNPVSLDNAGQLFTTWAYDLPALATGAYKIDLRVTDAVGNSNFVDGAWDVAVIAPDVLVSKQSDVTLAATGDTISYTIAYTNASPAPATGVVITEVVPVDTTFDAVLSDPGWSCLPDGSAGSNCTLALGTLAAEAGGTLTFTVTAADTWSAGTTAISNTVSIATDGVDGNPADNTDHHQIPIDGGIDLTVVITDGGAVFQYDAESPDEAPPLVYTMTYTNAGSQPAQPQLSINWSQGGGLYSTAPGGWTCEGLTRTCTQALGTLNIGQSGVVTFPLRTSYFVPDDRLITTTVEIEDLAGATEVITGNNTANVVTPIQLDYALVPEQASLTIQEGDVVTNGVELLVPPETDLEFFRFATFPPPSAGEFFGRSFERTAEDLTWQWVYTSTDGLEQTQPVTWYVTIGEGSFIVSTVFSMTVANVAPTVVITGNDTVASGTLYNLSLGEVTDPGDDTVTACTLDWGDSSNEDCLSSLGGGTLSHTYGNNYSKPVITVNLTDEDGTHIAASKTITVTGLSTSLTVDQTSVTAYESETVTNKGTYSPADAAFIWSASEGVVSDEGNGVWSWSRDAGSAESTRPVTITADSQTISFTLTVQGDGVPSSIEAGAPNSGDGNSDGVPDQAQMHVASLPSPLTGDYVTLAASPGLTLTNVSLTATPSAGDGSQPAGIQFPLGYLDFDLTGMGPGGNANVTLLITGTGTSNINSYAQYDALSGWYTFLYDDATATGAELVTDERIILYLVDGDRGDGDGTADGTIANLGGPANQQAAKTLTVNISGSGSVSPPAGDYAQGTVLTMVATPDPAGASAAGAAL